MEGNKKIIEAAADTYIEKDEIIKNIEETDDINKYFTVRQIGEDEIYESISDEQSVELKKDIDVEDMQIKENSGNGEYGEFILLENENIPDDTKIYVEGDLSFHMEGYGTTASGKGAHAEGDSTKAIGQSAHAEGTSTKAIGFGAHAEGIATYARENGAHAQGIKTKATKDGAHAEGNRTLSEGFASHSEGFKTVSNALASHAEGYGTTTNGLDGAHVMGRFGEATHPYSWHIANGISEEFKGIGARIQGNGFGALDLGWSIGGRGYAEMFETLDGEPIEPGYFVTLEGGKIRKANRKDDFILGITSANAGIIGNAGELRWKNKYETDEWGRIQYRSILVPPVLNEDGYEIFPEHYEIQPQLNPEWDSSQEYIPRLKRSEWVPVVIKGCVLVRDDGSCRVNSYCRCNNRGFATPGSRGVRVLERISENQILVLVY